MDVIDNYFCALCGRLLKQTIRKGILISVSCSCGYKNKSTLDELARARAIQNRAELQN